MQHTRAPIHLLNVVAVVAVSLGACGGGQKATTSSAPHTSTPESEPASPQPEPTANATTLEQRAQKAFSLLTAYVRVAAAYRGDCDAAAAALNQWFDDNREAMAQAKEWDRDPEFRKLMSDKYPVELLRKEFEPLVEVSKECKDNAAFGAAAGRVSD